MIVKLLLSLIFAIFGGIVFAIILEDDSIKDYYFLLDLKDDINQDFKKK